MKVEEFQEEQKEERQRRIDILNKFQKENSNILNHKVIQNIEKTSTNDIKEQEKPLDIKGQEKPLEVENEKPKLVKEVKHTQEPQKDLKDLLLSSMDDEAMFSQIARTRQANKFNGSNSQNIANKSGLFQRHSVN